MTEKDRLISDITQMLTSTPRLDTLRFIHRLVFQMLGDRGEDSGVILDLKD